MSLDRSLKSANALIRHRNVLTRAERLEKLKEEEKWNESMSVFALPKVAHRKQEISKGSAKEQAATAAEGTVAAGAAPAVAGTTAPGATAGKAPASAAPAAPAGKAAAPAAKAPAAPAAKGKK